MDRDKAFDLARQTLLQEVETLQALAGSLDDAFWRVASLLSDCNGMIWITAVGTSAAVAARFAHILTCLFLLFSILASLNVQRYIIPFLNKSSTPFFCNFHFKI